MLPIVSEHIRESWKFNVSSASGWNKWITCYTVIAVVIIILAFQVNELIAIAETWVAVALARALKGKSECDKNNGKFIDKYADLSRIGVGQRQIEIEIRTEEESERGK